MKGILFAGLLALVQGDVESQNLVPNWSFEELSACPNDEDQVALANGWISYCGTVDLFNTCDGSDSAGVPSNFFGYQLPLAGSGYAGMIVYGGGWNYHGVLGIQLPAPLVVGQTYHVSSHFTWTASSEATYKYANSNMGMLFRTAPLFDLQWLPWPNYAHVYTENVIADSVDWVVVEGDFAADSAYQYMFIGNFFDDANTTAVLLDSAGQWGMSYYYVDGVCVVPLGGECDILANVGGTDRYTEFIVSPNPFEHEIFIKGPLLGLIQVQLFSLTGALLHDVQHDCADGFVRVPLPAISSGPYIIRVLKDQQELYKQLVLHQ